MVREANERIRARRLGAPVTNRRRNGDHRTPFDAIENGIANSLPESRRQRADPSVGAACPETTVSATTGARHRGPPGRGCVRVDIANFRPI